jgi:transcriptional regulator with XRE-family HTH domain
MTKAKATRGRLRLYRSYNFVDKDPVIDKVRTLVARENISRAHLARLSGVSVNALTGWFDGKTQRPQYATIAAVTTSLGYATRFVKARAVDFERELAKASEEIAAAKKKLVRAKAAAENRASP